MSKNIKKIWVLIVTVIVMLFSIVFVAIQRRDDGLDGMTKEQIRLSDLWHGVD